MIVSAFYHEWCW